MRQEDALSLSNLDQKFYFDEAESFMAVRYRLDRALTGADQYLLVASDGTSAETMGLRVDGPLITAAVRTNATTITLTLASAPTGTETLYYIYDADLSLTAANVLTDNASVSLPLQAAKILL